MIAAIAMVKDEADIIIPVVRQLFDQGVDRLWIADNMSADPTRGLLEDLARDHPITILDDPEPGYYQSQKMTRLARVAHDAGATWIVPFDADEWWYGLGGTIAEVLAGCDADIIRARGYDHLPRPDDQADNPIIRMGWRRPHPQTWPKVVFRSHPDALLHMGNHDVEHPGRRVDGLLEYRHFGYRSFEQMARKVRQGKAAYEASTVHEMHGTHWRVLGALGDDELAAEWQKLLDEQPAVFDPAPTGTVASTAPPAATVSVVVPHYGSSDLTVACLAAVAEHSPGVEVVVVDNGTGDLFPADVRITNEENLGFATACNQGAAAATGEIVIFLNNDTEVRAGWLEPLVARLDGGAGIVGSCLVYPDGTIQHAGVFIYRTSKGVLTAEHYRDHRPARPVEAVTAACLAVHRDVFIKLGGFDVGYRNGYEDVDFCLTARAAGFEVWYEPASVVMHHESASGPARWTHVADNIRRLQTRWGDYGRDD